MSEPRLTVVIATCQRAPLLRRTLESLATCERPPAVRRVLVIENGPRLQAEVAVRGVADRLPIRYEHSPVPSKSVALNHAISRCGDDFIVFFDDDVRIEPGTLRAYCRAIAGRQRGLFIGGRCEVDYEEAPPEWLHPYLPLSAKGWSLGDQACPLTVPHALGFNWGAFAGDLRTAGGFDPTHGPGRRIPIGEETDLQAALLALGVEGLYLPEARVWHFVPRARCSRQWALQRARLMGFWAGERPSVLSRSRRAATWIAGHARLVAYQGLIPLVPARLAPAWRFHLEHRRAWRRGLHAGWREARLRPPVPIDPPALPNPAAAAPVSVFPVPPTRAQPGSLSL